MSELCRRQIIRQQQIMKKGALTVLIALLPLAAIAQTPSINEDGKKIEKEKMETKDYLPEVHGTIRAKYEYQTTMGAGRFEVRNARVSVTGNVLPSVAYKAEIDLSDEGQIKMLDAYARLFPTKGLTVTAGTPKLRSALSMGLSMRVERTTAISARAIGSIMAAVRIRAESVHASW